MEAPRPSTMMEMSSMETDGRTDNSGEGAGEVSVVIGEKNTQKNTRKCGGCGGKCGGVCCTGDFCWTFPFGTSAAFVFTLVGIILWGVGASSAVKSTDNAIDVVIANDNETGDSSASGFVRAMNALIIVMSVFVGLMLLFISVIAYMRWRMEYLAPMMSKHARARNRQTQGTGIFSMTLVFLVVLLSVFILFGTAIWFMAATVATSATNQTNKLFGSSLVAFNDATSDLDSDSTVQANSTAAIVVENNDIDVDALRRAEAPLCVLGDIANKTCNGTFNGEPVTFTVSLNLNEINYTYVNAPPTRAVADDVDDASTTVPAADSADDLDATPAADAGETQTTAPAADNTDDSDTTPPANAGETQTAAPATDNTDDSDVTPAADAGEAQTTAPAADNTDDLDATPPADAGETQTTAPAADNTNDSNTTPPADAGETQTTAPAADNTNDSDATMTSVDNTSDSSESDETEGASRRGGVLAITALPPATLDAIMLETINVLSIFNFTAAEDTMTTPTVDFIVTQRDAIARTLTIDELQAYNTTLRAELCPAEICFDVSKLGFFDLDACVCNEQLQQLYQYSKDSRNSLGLSVAGAFVLLTGLVLALPAAASNLVNIRLRTELSSSMMPSPAISYSSASKAPVAV